MDLLQNKLVFIVCNISEKYGSHDCRLIHIQNEISKLCLKRDIHGIPKLFAIEYSHKYLPT